MNDKDYFQIRAAQDINRYYVEGMTDIVGSCILAMLSENYELVEKTITPDGEAITKVYTLEPYGHHEKMRKELQQKNIQKTQENACKPSVFKDWR